VTRSNQKNMDHSSEKGNIAVANSTETTLKESGVKKGLGRLFTLK